MLRNVYKEITMEIRESSRSLRRELSDILTLAMITSARVAVQEYEERCHDPIPGPAPIDVERLKEFTRSAAYQQAMKAYAEGRMSLRDLAHALEPMRAILPWLVGRE